MTLGDIVTDIRNTLDDNLLPYYWSIDELVKYTSNTIDELCEECYILEDDEATISITGVNNISFNSLGTITKATGGFLSAGFYPNTIVTITNTTLNNSTFYITEVTDTVLTTTSTVATELTTSATIIATTTIFRIPILLGVPSYVIDERLVRITSARLDSQTVDLSCVDTNYMDSYFSGWKSASNAEPSHLILSGVGTKKIRLYSTPVVNDVLRLVGFRMPYKSLATADVDTELEIRSKFQRKLYNGILAKAYKKQDSETEDFKRTSLHEGLYKIDKDEIRKFTVRFERQPKVNAPLAGNL